MIKPINIMLCIPTRFSICSHNYSTNPTSLILIFRVVVNCLLCTLSCAPVFRMPNASHWLYQSNIFFTYLSIYLEFISPQTENLTRTFHSCRLFISVQIHYRWIACKPPMQGAAILQYWFKPAERATTFLSNLHKPYLLCLLASMTRHKKLDGLNNRVIYIQFWKPGGQGWNSRFHVRLLS